MEVGFSFDLARCSGCMACVVACMDQNDIPGEGRSFRDVIRLEQGQYPSAKISFISLACFHCMDAPCINVCPKGAISRNAGLGVVMVSEDLCIGCHTCAVVCPFGAPQFYPGEKMRKCNFCIDRVTHGFQPACARTCPTKALGFGPLEELSSLKAKKASVKIWEAAAKVGSKVL
jgi:anaerobic dimethyl sulfoxide reductase subunit B (iron-sulfur subunit)